MCLIWESLPVSLIWLLFDFSFSDAQNCNFTFSIRHSCVVVFYHVHMSLTRLTYSSPSERSSMGSWSCMHRNHFIPSLYEHNLALANGLSSSFPNFRRVFPWRELFASKFYLTSKSIRDGVTSWIWLRWLSVCGLQHSRMGRSSVQQCFSTVVRWCRRLLLRRRCTPMKKWRHRPSCFSKRQECSLL